MHSLFLPIIRRIKGMLLLLAVITVLSSKGERKQKINQRSHVTLGLEKPSLTINN